MTSTSAPAIFQNSNRRVEASSAGARSLRRRTPTSCLLPLARVPVPDAAARSARAAPVDDLHQRTGVAPVAARQVLELVLHGLLEGDRVVVQVARRARGPVAQEAVDAVPGDNQQDVLAAGRGSRSDGPPGGKQDAVAGGDRRVLHPYLHAAGGA